MHLSAIFASTDYWDQFKQQLTGEFLLASVRITVIIIGYLVARVVASRLIKGLLNSSLVKLSGDLLKARKARVRALNSLLTSAVGFILAFITVITVLQEAHIQILPLLTSAGVLGLAIAFGAQKMVKDVISGFFILMEDQYGVGDIVTISGVTGVVEGLELRTTRIRDTSGKLYILSNGDISQVCNHSRGKLTMFIDLPIAASADLAKARQVLNEVGFAMVKDYPEQVKEAFKCDGLAAISATATTVRLTGTVSGYDQEKVRTELNARVKDALERNSIALG